jgi:hypothetical protein
VVKVVRIRGVPHLTTSLGLQSAKAGCDARL